jgi:protease I
VPGRLEGKKIAILATDGVEQVELTEPRKALAREGAKTVFVSPKADRVQAFNHLDKGDKLRVDLPLDQADPSDFDALMLPGGALNPDALRLDPKAIQFVRSFFDAGKPVGAICHAPWILIDAGVIGGRMVTSWPSIRIDLSNAGAIVVDREVVDDDGLVTSRKPDDIPAFSEKLIEECAATGHTRHHHLEGTQERPTTYM